MRTLDEIRCAVIRAIDKRRDEILALGEFFWKNPEPGYREFKTSEKAVRTLRNLGLDVKEKRALTGFRSDIPTGKEGPTVALLGEMDSLILPSHPEADKSTGAVHACGHNTHITALLGAAMGLADSRAAEELSGRIALVGVPAEEGIEMDYRMSLMEKGLIRSLNGKPQMIREGIFDDVDMAFMNHVGSYYVSDFNGHVKKQITFLGRSSHAASPQNGVNALNAANLAMHAIALMRETFANDDRIRVHGIIRNGGDAVNIVPDHVVMDYMVRADTVEKILALSGRFDRAVSHSALAIGADADIRTFAGSMPLKNDDDLCEVFREIVRYLDPAAVPSIKASFNQGCTDMGDMSQIMPSIHGGVPGCSGACHGINFRISDPEQAYLTNAKILALAAVDLLYGNAEKGKRIAAKKSGMMSIPDYIARLDSMIAVVDTRRKNG